jgi:putative ABC transport system ATP-binding protein
MCSAATEAAAPYIRTSGLTKIYAGDRARVAALDGVDLEFEAGTFAAITGPSGSGKSTLLNLLGGLDTPTEGEIEIAGENISRLDRDGLALFRRRRVGMIFQSFNLLPSRSAAENVEFPLIFAGVGRRERRARAAGLLEKIGLAGRSGHLPAELSGGEQQRVAIARALVGDPEVLLADEPTGNLDSRTSREVIELLAGLNRGRGLTVIMVTHEQALACEFAREIVSLRDGRVASREALR